MSKKSLIIYCDESAEKGRYYSHFYGGAVISASERELLEDALNNKKASLNLHKELKWTYITKAYAQKYIEFIDLYFDLIQKGLIKVRIMFIQNMYVATSLDEYQIDNQYFLLYYQLIKHSFGLRYSNSQALNDVHVAIYLDDVPDTQEKFDNFKDYISTLSKHPAFKKARIVIPRNDVVDVNSKAHVILQGLDIILGAMQFRLNDKHLDKPQGSRHRGHRTLAKEKVYKHINKRICQIYPYFNIGVSTGQSNGPKDKWDHAYRHWSFVPAEHKIDSSKTKRKK